MSANDDEKKIYARKVEQNDNKTIPSVESVEGRTKEIPLCPCVSVDRNARRYRDFIDAIRAPENIARFTLIINDWQRCQ